ncbi:universal stress protein, partial [Chloroflexota bacterium]
MFKRILVCLDGSELSNQIVPYAAEMASRFGSQLVLLRVMEHLHTTIVPGGVEPISVS